MNIVGIVAEYNPMHNGHVYHIKKAKELTNADYVILVMSGAFTEQGNICTLDKFTRARFAIQNGADMVIELPVIHATASAEKFAYGAVDILNSLGIVTHIAFGAEEQDITPLSNVAKTCIENEDVILSKTKEYLKTGCTFPEAKSLALKEYLSKQELDILNKPNNILGIEYIKALLALKSQIKPILIHREETSHRDTEIANAANFASSTAIRETLSDNTTSLDEKLEKLTPVVPENVLEEIALNNFNTNEKIWSILRTEILKLSKDGLKNILDVTEGLETRLYDSLANSSNYNEYIQNVKTKRYTLSRIKRICIYILLGITKDLNNELQNVNYARVLKVKKDATNLLSLISNNGNTKLITKITDNILDSLENAQKKSIKLDVLASNIASKFNADFTNNIEC